ncbi:MAG: hypothetical protein AAF846_15550 [Chloroflexota bacterium]
MKRLLSLTMIVSMLILAACRLDEPVDLVAETSVEPEVSFTVTGSVDASAQGRLNFFCDDGDGLYDSFYDFSASLDGQLLSFTLQRDLSGTVALLGGDDEGTIPGEANYVEYRDTEFTEYESGTGTLTIESYPASEGDSFVATMTAELSDSDGNVVTVDASFNIIAGASAYEDCLSE